MQSSVINVTPAQACVWLESNTFNRKVSRPTVNKYADDMSAGNWTLNHQGIAFDNKGTLVDGQHRLHAIVKSGVTIPMLVTFGSDRVGVDELRVRSQFDVIKFGGMSEWLTKKKLETGRVAASLFFTYTGSVSLSTTKIMVFCNEHKNAIDWVDSVFKSNVKGVSLAAVRGVFMAAYYHYDHAKLEEMVASLYSGMIADKSQTAAIRARDMMIEGGFSGGSASRVRAAKKLSRAIDRYCNNTSLSKLVEQNDFSFKLPEGDV